MGITANLHLSYNITNQYLMSSHLFLERAQSLQDQFKSGLVDAKMARDAEVEHMGLICSIAMQCVGALEVAIYQVINSGPGHHLGSNGVNAKARDYTQQFGNMLDRLSVLEKYSAVLMLLGKDDFKQGENPYQSAKLLVDIRNELVHFKPSAVNPFDESSEKMLKKLKSLRLGISPFPGAKSVYFPKACLSLALGKWILDSTVAFLEDFYVRLGTESSIKGYTAWASSR